MAESERNATLREQVAGRDARIGQLEREVERLTNLAYANGQVAQRLRDRLVEQATHNRRLIGEKDALVRDRVSLAAHARRMRLERDDLVRSIHDLPPVVFYDTGSGQRWAGGEDVRAFVSCLLDLRRRYPRPPSSREAPGAEMFDGKGQTSHPV